MYGLPFSGKSYFVNKLIEKYEDIILVDPKSYLPPEFETLDESLQSQFRIASWSVCTDYLNSVSQSSNGKIYLFDSTASAQQAIGDLATRFRIDGNATILIKINTELSVCKARAGDKWMNADVEQKYLRNFSKCVIDKYFDYIIDVDTFSTDIVTNLVGILKCEILNEKNRIHKLTKSYDSSSRS